MGRSCAGTLSRVLIGQMFSAVEWNTLHYNFMVRILMECTTQICMRKWAGEINQGEDCCYTVGGGIVRTLILHSEKRIQTKTVAVWKLRWASGLHPAGMEEENVFMCNAKAIVNDGFYSAGVELHPMSKSAMDLWVDCKGSNGSVSWMAWASAKRTHAVKPVQHNSHTYCKAHPSAVRAWIIQSHPSLSLCTQVPSCPG